jgi:nucleotide-binding universal stress UspA family protein
MAAALPQSHRHAVTDGGRDGGTYGDGVFASTLVALSGQAEGRDAVVLAAQLADADATIVVAHVMATSAAPLTGGNEAAARRRASLRDGGEEVYATLGPDPRVRYLPLSGLPFAEAVIALARREQPDTIVVGQNLIYGEPGIGQLLADTPCPVVVAPYGHRFVRSFFPARITVACGPPGPTDQAVGLATALAERAGLAVRLIAAGDGSAEEWLAHAQELAPAAAASRVAGRGAGALVAQTRGDVDMLVTAGADDEMLRQAACPVLVVPAVEHGARQVAVQARR